MARQGVPQDEVFQAADALLAAGERPTADKVRAALGRGSPNALGPVLDRWWAQLAHRLAAQRAMPGVPEAVGEAFAHAWDLALAAGQAHAETQVAPERAAIADVLAKAQAASANEYALRATLETQLAIAQGEASAHHAALVMSDQRNGDLQRQVAAHQAELQSLTARLDATLVRHHLVVQQADSERTAAANEREALQTHLRQVEDRAYGEVDRIRQELKANKAQLVTQARDYAANLRKGEQTLRDLQAKLAKAERENAVLQGRITAGVSPKKAPPRRRAASAASSRPKA